MIDFNAIDANDLARLFEQWLDNESPDQNNIQISRDLIAFIEAQQSE